MERFERGPPFFGSMPPPGMPDMPMYPGGFPPGFDEFPDQQQWKRPRMEGGGDGPPMGMDQMGPNFAMSGPPKQKSIFWKTRLCIKWRQGNCPHGEICNFAHGERELRVLPPELLAQLEQNKMTKQSQQHEQMPASAAGSPPPEPNDNKEGVKAPPAPQGSKQDADSNASLRQIFYKTRLCNKFMQIGFCPYGPKCIFAHGHEDLRQPPEFGGPNGPDGPPGPGMAPPSLGGPLPPPKPPIVGLPGKVPPPRPPPGPPPPHIPPTMPISAAGALLGNAAASGSAAAQGKAVDLPYIERVRLLCSLLSVGKLSAADNAQPQLQAALLSLRTRQAFRENPYADGLEAYMRG